MSTTTTAKHIFVQMKTVEQKGKEIKQSSDIHHWLYLDLLTKFLQQQVFAVEKFGAKKKAFIEFIHFVFSNLNNYKYSNFKNYYFDKLLK